MSDTISPELLFIIIAAPWVLHVIYLFAVSKWGDR